MQDENGFYAPLQYQPQWLWLGLMLVLLIGAWYAWILRPVRKKTPDHSKAPLRQVRSAQDLETLRTTCLTAINATTVDADAGRLPERDAHQRLSFLVREFVGAATGLPVTSMTLEDLQHHHLRELAAGIAGIYPNEFAATPVHSVRQSAEAARQVVSSWN
ncbi:hypothetical protein [Arthrobacter sp. Rue61a]|uniref:hypothetical protein n=1 Tax=Arthrobacter sp. Rue61a TaxID=1118963 RepID=UPI00027DF6B1|nr:hypothetical protein [Arthrobacter sp. Rue61a]AFR29403.1 hypothetical protein ARUE_c25020 [Arthrobacter sp. Rue61a]